MCGLGGTLSAPNGAAKVKGMRSAHLITFAVLGSWACVPPGEPANPAVVQVEISPGNQQSYSAAPDRIAISLIGRKDDVRPVLEVSSSAEFVDLARGTRVALTPIETPRDVTYRGSEDQWFAFPAVGDGEYEIAVQLTAWGLPLVAGATAMQDGGVWRSRFQLDANRFYLSGLSVCGGTNLVINFSEPFGEMSASDLASRVIVQMNQSTVSCPAVAPNGTVGGSILQLQCASALQAPFKVTFAQTLTSAEGAKPLSARSPPHGRLTEFTITGAPLVQQNDCAGWATP